MRYSMGSFIDWFSAKYKSYDRFGHGVTFNISGDSVVRSYWGASVSLFLNIFIIAYAYSQFWYLWGRTRFTNTAILQGYMTVDNTTVNMTEHGLKFAIALVDKETLEWKDPTNYVTFGATVLRSGDATDIDLELEICNDQDWEQFYEPSPNYNRKIAKIRQQNAFLCIKDESEMIVFGPEGADDHSYFDIYAYACDYNKNPSCNSDKSAMESYLQGTEIVILKNEQYFNSDDINKATKMVHQSTVFEQEILPDMPRYSMNYLKVNYLFDVTDLVAVGYNYDSLYYYGISHHAMQASVYRQYPSNYKLTSYMVYLDQSLYKTSRKVYDIFSFLGSVGGIQYNFDTIGAYICVAVAATNARYFFNNKLYKVHDRDYKKSRIMAVLDYKRKKKDEETWRKQITADYEGRKHIDIFRYTTYIANFCCRWYRFERKQRILKKGVNRMNQELDIMNHLKAQRLQSLQIRSLLTKKQFAFSKKLSEFIITDEETSTDDELHSAKPFQKRKNTILEEMKGQNVEIRADSMTSFKQAIEDKFFKQLQKSLHTNWFKQSLDEPLPDLKPIMESSDKVDVRMVNLVKAYDAVRIKRWSDVFIPPDLIDTSDYDANTGKVNLDQERKTSPEGLGGGLLKLGGNIEMQTLADPKPETAFGGISNDNEVAFGQATGDRKAAQDQEDADEAELQQKLQKAMKKADDDDKN